MQGYAGGHEERLAFSVDGRVLLKKTSMEEAHFYLWLRRLAQIDPPEAGDTGAAVESAVISPEAAALAEPAEVLGGISTKSGEARGSPGNFVICPLGCLQDCPLLALDCAWQPVGEGHANDSEGGPSGGETENANGDRKRRGCRGADCSEGSRCIALQLLQWMPFAFRVYRSDRGLSSESLSRKEVAAVELENVLFGLETPLVIDIKIGTRLHGDLATPLKRQRAALQAKARGATSLGISFSGLWGIEDGQEMRWRGGSRQQRGAFIPTNLDAYVELFRAFLVSGGAQPARVASLLLSLLRSLKQLWSKQRIVNLYGSSLLFVSGAQSHAPGTTADRTVKLKLIDFAHATLFPQESDTGYLRGIESLILAVEAAAASCREGPGASGCRELLDLWAARGSSN
ncbi:inositol polyphosphate kinase [Cyclospora cayetanensis]|uniref:Kinase n=1 Tax=Cyclospora cayetanensis TaxID=88456 RepID=A0A1D3CU23_9EIME|nr:inositol polyphosphate kinase [Cyclospora cayetanensis]